MFAQVISPLIRGYKFQKNPIEFFDDVQRRYGDLAKLSFPGKKIVFAFHPRHAEHVLKSAKDRYGKNRDVLHAILDLSGDTGLIQMTDEEAVKLRGAVMPLFRRPFLDEIPKFVASVCDELFADLDEAARLELPVDLRPFLTRLVLDVAGFVVLGVPRLEKSLAMHASFSRLNYLAGLRLRSPLHGTRGGQRRRAVSALVRELDNLIAEGLTTNHASVVRYLREARYSDREIADQARAFLFAGYDTTLSSLLMATDCVSRDHSVQERLAHDDVSYAEAVYKESLRLFPSAYFLPRETVAYDDIDGLSIEPGTSVFLSIRHIQRNPEVFESPDQFQPGRFIQPKHPQFAFIPFGGGVRVCPGGALAVVEAAASLKLLFQRYRMKALTKEPVIEGLITASLKSPLLVQLQRREGT